MCLSFHHVLLCRDPHRTVYGYGCKTYFLNFLWTTSEIWKIRSFSAEPGSNLVHPRTRTFEPEPEPEVQVRGSKNCEPNLRFRFEVRKKREVHAPNRTAAILLVVEPRVKNRVKSHPQVSKNNCTYELPRCKMVNYHTCSNNHSASSVPASNLASNLARVLVMCQFYSTKVQ